MFYFSKTQLDIQTTNKVWEYSADFAFPWPFAYPPIESSVIFLKVGVHGKFKLIHKDLLKGCNIILFIEDEHGLFILNRVDRAEGNGAVMIAQQNGVANDPRCSFISISKGLYIGDQH